jgi:hypothetical protein
MSAESSRRLLTIAGWVVFGAAIVGAFGRAITSTPRAAPPPAEERAMRNAYLSVTADERNFRREVIKDFPADPWSQDDGFHNHEYRRARQIGGQRGMSLQDVLLAMDRGMREHWPKPAGIHQNPSVPPCRPRPIH